VVDSVRAGPQKLYCDAHNKRKPQLTGRTGHALRGKTAGAFGPDLAKKLSQLVKMEKNVMRSLETVAKERMEVAVRVQPP
jgi:hypothetical protein